MRLLLVEASGLSLGWKPCGRWSLLFSVEYDGFKFWLDRLSGSGQVRLIAFEGALRVGVLRAWEHAGWSTSDPRIESDPTQDLRRATGVIAEWCAQQHRRAG